jgi:hypothetical protein
MNFPVYAINHFTRCIRIQYGRFPPIVIWHSVILANFKPSLHMTINGFSYNTQTPLKILLKFGMRNFRSKFQGTPLVILYSTILRVPFLALFHFSGLDVSEMSINKLFVLLFYISSDVLSIQRPSLLLRVVFFLCICRSCCILLCSYFVFWNLFHIFPRPRCMFVFFCYVTLFCNYFLP